MTTPTSGLDEFLAEIARDAGAAPARGGEFVRAGRPFAAVSGNAAEFRLESEIAEAALGTPATSPSLRGPDWVRLTVDPSSAQDFDRAKAWFLSAYRYAERTR